MFHKNLFFTLIIVSLLAACSKHSPFEDDKAPLNSIPISQSNTPVFNEQVIEINQTQTGQLDKHDLARFVEKIGDARIVGLGEQTHGTGSVFTLKNQLIQYLHQAHNFDLFIIESGMYDVNTLWQQAKQGQRIKNNAPGNIFYMYANTDEVTPLFDYINQQAKTNSPLTFVGFDSQHTGALSNKGLVNDLELSLTNESYKFPTNWQLFKEQLQQVLNVSSERLKTADEKMFFAQLEDLQQFFLAISKHKRSDITDTIHNDDKYNKTGFWYRITRGLEAQAKRQWKMSDNRSEEMGKNIEWWATQYPDKKIIVWAHSGHLYRTGFNQVNAGQVLSERFGEQYYMVHFTSNDGEFLDFTNMGIKAVSDTNNNSFESIVSQKSQTNLSFINVLQQSLMASELAGKELEIFINRYQDTLLLSQWEQYMDGVFVFKKVEAAHYK